MKGENSFNPYTVRIFSYGKCSSDSGIFKTDYQALINLNSLGLSFNDFKVNFNRISYTENGRVFSLLLSFNFHNQTKPLLPCRRANQVYLIVGRNNLTALSKKVLPRTISGRGICFAVTAADHAAAFQS